jgi:uncharacterized membrane protein
MQFIAAYIAAIIVFVAIDGTWLSVMGTLLYRPVLGDILLSSLRVAPALVFYAMFPIGIVVFAVLPALRSGATTAAFLHGLLLGAIAYGTYDLTNYATLRNWNLQLTLIDIAYGAIATGVAATLATVAARSLASWLGGATG